MDLTIIILTYNEERHIERCLHAVEPLNPRTIVVDSYSSDRTVEIAKAHGSTVLQHPFVNYAKQFQWAIDNAPITSGWVMRLDADEIIEPDLVAEIRAKLSILPEDVTGVNLKRKTIFLGRWIRHGGRFPLTLLRIWRRGKARIEDRWMDEHMVLTDGRAITLDGGFADHSLCDLTFFTDKHNKYATREAIDVLNQRRALFVRDRRLDARSTSLEASWKRYVKERIYNRIPFEIAAFSYFGYRYILRLGFLDGREGLAYHFLQGFWYRFLVGAKVRELEAALNGLHEPEAIKSELARLTGMRVSET